MKMDSQTATSEISSGGVTVSATDRRPFSSEWRPLLGDINWTRTPQDTEATENVTAYQEPAQDLSAKMVALFAAAKDEYFEDGMESDFSRGLVRLIHAYGEKAVIELAFLILLDQTNAEIASEALRWLGHMEDARSYQRRLWLLERSLFMRSGRIRDGAVLGLASLDNPHAIRYLRQAIDQEPSPELRHDMEQVLAQLETGS
jgi:hypothetical protein